MEIDLSGTTEPAHGDIAEVLSHQYRRRVIDILLERAEPLSLSDLALELARKDGDEDTWESAQRLRVELYHIHIPKLEMVGLVAYDEEYRTVTISPARLKNSSHETRFVMTEE